MVMKNFKEILKDIFQAFLVIVIVCAIWLSYTPTDISYFKGCVESSINLNNLQEVIGVNDYVFVGYVEETYDYNHDRFFHKFPEIIDYYGGPFTECKVTVIESIKGNIEKDTVLSYYKVGGVTSLRTSIYLDVEEGQVDYYPQKDNYYIFRGSAHPDGTITGGGTYSTDKLEKGYDETTYKQSSVYKKWIDAYENQITENACPPFYLCSADADYGDGTYNAEIYEAYIKTKAENSNYVDEEYYKALKNGNPKIK